MDNSVNGSSLPQIRAFHVFVEVLILFLIVNIVFALINPPISALAFFNHVLPGFKRYPIIQTAQVGSDGQSTFSAEVVTNLNVLFPSHIISGLDKSKDEYRVILLGDSSARGARLLIEQTLTEQINRAQLITCNNRRIVVYNLGLPGPAIIDLMILDEAIKNYSPDLIVWTFTMNAFLQPVNDGILSSNLGRIHAIEQTTNYNFLKIKDLSRASSFIDRTIYGRRGELNLLLRLSLLDISYLSIGTDEPRIMDNTPTIQEKSVDEDDMYDGLKSGDNITDVIAINHPLIAASKISRNVPIIFINEPIYIRENNPVRYNLDYPRWAYDQYRDILHNMSSKRSWNYLDLWNLLPPNEFSNTDFHRTVEGETRLVRELIPVIQTQSCK